MLPIAVASGAGCAAWLWRGAAARHIDFAWVPLAAATWAGLMWLARPAYLPLGSGPDLTHHLLLINFIGSHWTLVHDPTIEWWLGEMVQYTPGSHALVALAAAWTGHDGLHAVHPVVAATVALKLSILFLIVLRLVPDLRAPVRAVFALAAVLMLGFPLGYAIGGFAHDSFVAQVVAEMFVVAMWWALSAWDDEPRVAPAALFALFGAAAFLTWPVLVGAPMLAAACVMIARGTPLLNVRLRHAAVAALPILVVAGMYLVGRIGWLAIVRTGGLILHPSLAEYTPWFLAASVAGVLPALLERHARTTLAFAGAVLLESAALFAVARTRGPETPYMALKMFYLLVCPQAALAALALAAAIRLLSRRIMHTAPAPMAAWSLTLVIGVGAALHARTVLARPLSVPAVSEPLAQAARWAADHAPASCVEYLVGDTNTAYWLHLAALGNRRMSARTADPSTFELRDALVRWLTPGGLPYAIADRRVLPADISRELDVVADFGTAAVAKRRGPAVCPDE